MSIQALREAKNIFLLLAVGIILFSLLHYWIIVITLLVLTLGVILFFRDPKRKIPEDPLSIVSPADGTVDAIEDLPFLDVFQGPGKRVSIFLSVFDVHINRIPYSGKIRNIIYKTGQFMDARRSESALQNENQLLILETSKGLIGIRQIAGLIAQRIVKWCHEGETVTKGQRFGLIKFGSRTDLYLPYETEVLVKLGQKVKGASTIVARWTS